MATSAGSPGNAFSEFFQSALGRNLALGAGISLVAGIMLAVWMWNQKPDYRVLLSNYSDKDGGAMIAALQQMNIPYQFSGGGGAILVPAERVHDARLKLAAQGLPRGGNVGFELMENQKLGASQFLEQVNFQRATEGELARSINSIAVIQASRVHLAIPKPSVFIRDKQKPTASVLLNLHPGRTIDRQQVSAIVHLVSSSVPELSAENITVVDQNGVLLSALDRQTGTDRLDPNQLKYVQEIQEGIVKRIESILAPILGVGNLRAEASAEVDFTRSEQAAETYKPNGTPEPSAIRSSRSNESSAAEPIKPGGIPGSSSNQVPSPAQTAASANNMQKENTVNYELDKTIRYVQHPVGNVKRLTVAVLVNHIRETAADGKVTMRALSDTEKTQITDLVKESMGFNTERGDSLSVANVPFAVTPREIVPDPPFWQQFANLDTAKTAGQYLLSGLVLLYLFFGLLRPMIKRLSIPPAAQVEVEASSSMDSVTTGGNSKQINKMEMTKQMAAKDPKVVANVVKDWVNSNE